jgi:hypothetical protein
VIQKAEVLKDKELKKINLQMLCVMCYDLLLSDEAAIKGEN